MHSLNLFAAHAWTSAVSRFRSLASAWLAMAALVFTTVQSRAAGPVLSDANLFAALNLDHPGLEAVKANVNGGNLPAAKTSLATYLRSRTNVTWYWDPHAVTTNVGYNQTSADQWVSGYVFYSGVSHTFPGGNIDWFYNVTKDPGNSYPDNNEWQWQLNRFGEWGNLGATYWGTSNESYAVAWVGQLRDWLTSCPAPTTEQNVAPSAWRTIESGLRMGGNWHNAYHRFLHSPSFTDQDVCDYLKSCIEHARYLLAYPSSGNWLMIEMSGLYTVGALFPELNEAGNWRTTAANSLAAEQVIQFYPDGPQKELSPVYHSGTLGSILSIYNMATLQGRRGELPANFVSGLEKSYEHYLRLMAPDRKLPQFNDCNGVIDAKSGLSAGYSLFPNRTDFQWVATDGASGTPPSFTSATYPWAGYNVMRSGWATTDNYLCFDAGPLGTGHWHQDKLNVVLSAYGKRILFDSGGGEYESSIWRTYGTATWSHNTVIVDGNNQVGGDGTDTYTDPDHTTQTPQTWRWESDVAHDFAAGTYNRGYGDYNTRPATHTRRVLFVKPDLYLVADTLSPNGLGILSHTYEARWHLLPTTSVTHPTTKVVATTQAGQPNLAIVPCLLSGLTVGTAVAQNSGSASGLLGWNIVADAVGHYPATTVTHKQSGTSTKQFLTLLMPLRTGEASPVTAVVSTGATSARVELADGRKLLVSADANSARGLKLTEILADNTTNRVAGGGFTPPTISAIANQVTAPSTPVGPVSFTVGSTSHAAANLVVSARSLNTRNVTNSGIALGGTGTNRTVTITPEPGGRGVATILLTVMDPDGATTATEFTVTVGTLNVDSEFNVAGDFEGWGGFYGIGSPSVTGGSLSGQVTNNDPQMVKENLNFDGTAVPYLLVRMKASQDGSAQFFWGRLGASGYSGSRVVTANYTGGNQWQVLAFPMLNHADWQGQVITEMRFDPPGGSGANFEIDYIRASNDSNNNAIWLGGTGNWNDNSGWSSGPPLPGDTATINGGRVNFTNNDTFGNDSTTTSASIKLNGGTLASNGWFTTIWNLNLNGGTLLADGGASPDFPAFQLAGTVTVGGSQASTIAATTAINANNQINIGGYGNQTLGFNVANVTGDVNSDLIINATLKNNNYGASSLTKSGAGTLLLNGVNTYTGTTSVTAGILNVNGSIASSGPISIAAGATLNAAGYNTLPNGNWTIAGTLNKTDAAIQDINNPITLNNGTIAGPSDNSDWGTFNLFGGPTITANGPANTINAARLGMYNGVTFATPNAGDALMVSSILGAANASGGGLTKTGSGTLTLTGANTYTGETIVSAGTLELASGANGAVGTLAFGSSITVNSDGILLGSAFNALGHSTGHPGDLLTVNKGGTLLVGAGTVLSMPYALNVVGGTIASVDGGDPTYGTIYYASTSGTFTSAIDGTAATISAQNFNLVGATFNVVRGGGAVDLNVTGKLIGGALVKNGNGVMALSGANTFSGGTTVSGGVLNLSGSLASAVTVSGGAFAPLGAPTAAGGITLGSGGTFRVHINGAGVGTGYDQLTVGGNVTLNGVLDLLAAPGLAPGTAFKIVNKTSAGAIGGTFSGKPEGSAFAAAGYVWLVTYSGGDGNDVLLTLATPMQSWRFTYFGTTANTGGAADLSDPNNDGENNFVEFATGQNPNAATRAAIGLVKNGATLEFTYTRSLAAMSDGVTFTVEWSDTLANDWSTAGVSSPSVLSDNGTTQQIKVSVPAGNGATRRFLHLKVIRP